LRLILLHEQSRGGEESREALGIGENRALKMAIRKAFAAKVPNGFQVLEREGLGQFQLSPKIVIEAGKWEALAAHPNGSVRNVVLKARMRVARA
jgi:hypothetical protein